MLVNNPMGSRRRRRFYHRAGVVPVPGEVPKEDYTDPNFYNYEMEPFDHTEEEEFKPTTQITQGGKRRVNFITVTSLHTRLLEIIDAMIALAEEEDREQAKQQAANQDADGGVDKEGAAKNDAEDAKDPGEVQATASKEEKE